MYKREFRITEDGSHTIFLPELNETYHSIHGAVQESTHVFIEHGLKYYLSKEKTKSARVFEMGFGTGLNALLTADFAEKHGVSIDYEGVEAFPISLEEVKNLNYRDYISGSGNSDLFEKIHQSPWNEVCNISPQFTLKKVNCKIEEYQPESLFDICYFDAFAPSKQAEMWKISILEKVGALLDKNGIFVTYCAKGQLKRDLKALGFEVETLPGPPGKMQMVRAVKI